MAPGRNQPPRGSRNPAVVEAVRLHRSRHRRETGLTLIEGPNLLHDALEAGVAVEKVFALSGDRASSELADRHRIELVVIGDEALARLAGTVTPRGPLAVIAIPEGRVDGEKNLLVAWGVSEPGNAGALIRIAAAFGWGYAHTAGAADPWSPKTLRAGAGGHFGTPISRVEGLGVLGEWRTVAAVPRGGVSPRDLGPGRYAVLVGEEAHGLPAEVVEAADAAVTIPMPGAVESLNAAVAAGILVYELSGS